MIKQNCDSRTIAHNLVPRAWIKIFSLEMVENDIYLGGASVASRHKMMAVNCDGCPEKYPQKWPREDFFIYINV